MNLTRVMLAALGAFIVYFLLGGATFMLFPALRGEFAKYPAVYRSQDNIKAVMPAGMAAMLLSMIALALLYALLFKGGPGLWEGARFGVLIGLFSFGAFVVHNYVNLNIGLKLTIEQAVAYFIQWTITGIVIGIIYRPVR